jgi:2-iminoacetate synthase ThiH
VHHTRHGRVVTDDLPLSGAAAHATEQFHIADDRSALEVAQQIRRLGYEPVWKDWDQALAA